MAKLIVRGLRDGDIETIAAGLRQADRDEIEATTGETDARPALQLGVDTSTLLWTIEVDGVAAGLFGTAPVSERTAVPWMLGTDALDRIPKPLVRMGRAYVHRMTEKYDTLLNYVDARNLKSIYWLARIGFKVSRDTVPWGVSGLPFHQFWIERTCARQI